MKKLLYSLLCIHGGYEAQMVSFILDLSLIILHKERICNTICEP